MNNGYFICRQLDIFDIINLFFPLVMRKEGQKLLYTGRDGRGGMTFGLGN